MENIDDKEGEAREDARGNAWEVFGEYCQRQRECGLVIWMEAGDHEGEYYLVWNLEGCVFVSHHSNISRESSQ